LLEGHVDKDFRVSWRRVADSLPGVDWQDVTANLKILVGTGRFELEAFCRRERSGSLQAEILSASEGSVEDQFKSRELIQKIGRGDRI